MGVMCAMLLIGERGLLIDYGKKLSYFCLVVAGANGQQRAAEGARGVALEVFLEGRLVLQLVFILDEVKVDLRARNNHPDEIVLTCAHTSHRLFELDGEEPLLVLSCAHDREVGGSEIAGELLLDGLLDGLTGQVREVGKHLPQLVRVLGCEDV
ncbi:hypothetical protein PENTCL1PPCAC_13366 [Pristionchus entomophagus]|uniref:Ribosomal protein n=1 Tax=Pristionchus entomophagus TaxID=358040 RepID=A0AAV5TFS1_9BILA|nr:hypothetical protein PENTCL1PPCAC_13366 [Pristionchus entomophagus]